jgi:hypothetical protein
MRAHYMQHVSFEGIGSIAPWLDLLIQLEKGLSCEQTNCVLYNYLKIDNN